MVFFLLLFNFFLYPIHIPRALNTGTCIRQGDLLYSAGLHRNHVLPTVNTGKIRRGFGKNAVEWTGRVEISKEEIPGSKRTAMRRHKQQWRKRRGEDGCNTTSYQLFLRGSSDHGATEERTFRIKHLIMFTKYHFGECSACHCGTSFMTAAHFLQGY